MQKVINRQLWGDRDNRESSLNSENTVKSARSTCQATESHSIFKKIMRSEDIEKKMLMQEQKEHKKESR